MYFFVWLSRKVENRAFVGLFLESLYFFLVNVFLRLHWEKSRGNSNSNLQGPWSKNQDFELHKWFVFLYFELFVFVFAS